VIKASVLQRFVEDWLEVRGLEPQRLEPDVWSFRLPKELRERFGRGELVFSFNQRALSRHPRSELATVGNPVFDRLLAVAREEGRVGIAFARPPSSAARPPALSKAISLGGQPPAKVEPTYQAVYHFVFTIGYPSIEAPDETEVVSVDGATLETWAQTPDLADLWGTLEPEPRKGRSLLPPLPIPPRVIETALAGFEKRMRRRIKKVLATSETRLQQEIESIQGYYEQLIEEARNQSRRWATKVEDREDRIRWLQLEWKRRTEEANEFWRPRVSARLVALGLQMMPRAAYRYAGPGKGQGRSAPRGALLVWDEQSRRFLPPYCEACGRVGLTEPRARPRGGMVCLECAGKEREIEHQSLEPGEKGGSPREKPRGRRARGHLTLVPGDR